LKEATTGYEDVREIFDRVGAGWGEETKPLLVL
jgi:hypothetical protein